MGLLLPAWLLHRRAALLPRDIEECMLQAPDSNGGENLKLVVGGGSSFAYISSQSSWGCLGPGT